MRPFSLIIRDAEELLLDAVVFHLSPRELCPGWLFCAAMHETLSQASPQLPCDVPPLSAFFFFLETKYIFIFNTKWKRQFPPLVHSPNADNSQAWVRLKLGGKNPIWVSPIPKNSRNLEPSPVTSWLHIGQKLGQKRSWDVNPGIVTWNMRIISGDFMLCWMCITGQVLWPNRGNWKLSTTPLSSLIPFACLRGVTTTVKACLTERLFHRGNIVVFFYYRSLVQNLAFYALFCERMNNNKEWSYRGKKFKGISPSSLKCFSSTCIVGFFYGWHLFLGWHCLWLVYFTTQTWRMNCFDTSK